MPLECVCGVCVMAEESSSSKVSKSSDSSSGGGMGGIPKAVFVVSAVGMSRCIEPQVSLLCRIMWTHL